MNRREMLTEALDSLVRQTRACDRAIVIDAGNDGSDRVCENYPFVEYFRQTTRGLTPARNEALALAREDYVGMLDSDDYYEPDFLKVCAKLLDDGADVVYSRGVRLSAGHRQPILVNHKPPTNFVKGLVTDNCVIASFALQRRSCLESIGGYREGLALADDYDLYLRLAMRNYRFQHAPLPLSNRRHHDGSLTLATPHANLNAIRDILVYHQSALCRHLDCSPQRLLSGCELRLGQLCFESGQQEQAAIHLKSALAGDPWNWRAWAYLLASLTAPFSSRAFEVTRRSKRLIDSLLVRLGIKERRW